MHDVIGDPAREVWFHSMFDGVRRAVRERDRAGHRARRGPGGHLRVLTDDVTVALAWAPGLDFPDPQEWPPAP